MRPHRPAEGGDPLGNPPTSGSAVQKPVRTYTIGPATMARVFQPAGLTNVSDLQAVLDAVEAALGAGGRITPHDRRFKLSRP